MKVYLLRHGESVHNAKGYSGKDCPLTDRGINQAKFISGTFDIVICSSLKRARQTLENTKIKYTCLYISELCRELKKDIADVKEDEPDDFKRETRSELSKRAIEFKNILKTFPKDKKILVVSHGIFLAELIGFELKNCEMVEFDPHKE
jgi:broad specificity phosphatase PhoE